jgi:hypothetical protein
MSGKLKRVSGYSQKQVCRSGKLKEDNGDISRAWDTIRENIKISAKESISHSESKDHKPWFDEECSELVDRRKQAKLQLLQDPIE